jgi:hypothetical protein
VRWEKGDRLPKKKLVHHRLPLPAGLGCNRGADSRKS